MSRFGPPMYSTVAAALVALGLDDNTRVAVWQQAKPTARISTKAGEHVSVWGWLGEDHPARVNLILEQLGRPERVPA